MISRSKVNWIFRIWVAALIAAIWLAALPAGADTWTQTTDADFENGETFMVEVDDGTLKLARGLGNQWHDIGEALNDNFGCSVASAGDVNGDGYDDVIVGAYRNDDNGNNAGKAYVYLGSATGISATALWTATGESAVDYFGCSVATAGDVNGDGYDDVIVGAYRNDCGGSDSGKVYVYLGSASGLGTTAAWTATGDAAGDHFGKSMATAGDVNGDGYDDIIVGAHHNDCGGENAGKAYVYLGSSSGLVTTDPWTAIGETSKDNFGCSVATAGDVNGDGYDDVIVGAYQNNCGGSDSGKVYVYLGSAAGLVTTDPWTATGESEVDYFGYSVASAGDVNGDSYSDVIVGAYRNDCGGSDSGKVYVYLGSATGISATDAWTATGEAAGDRFGSAVASAGDVNGDSYSDVIVGAHYNDCGGTDSGKVYLYLGSSSGLLTTASWTAAGEVAGDQFGKSMASAGDVNGDGYDDVIVGACYNDDGGYCAGKVYVYQNLDLWAMEAVKWTATGGAASDYFGWSVASAGDVNGDGYSDVIVGAYNDAGAAYVYHGSATGISAIAAWAATGEGMGDHFGHSVASAGDVNNDGYSDVIVGAHQNDSCGNDTGKAYVYLGSATGLNTTASWTATGEVAGDYFGYSVASAGDVNGDGYSDVIVGAHQNDCSGSDSGKIYLYFGSASGLVTTDPSTVAGEVAGDYFGYSVASAGDVNGDGYSDVIVGAYRSNCDYSNAGKAYVYHGSATGLITTASWTETGEDADDYFGYSVATAGDVDGDSYSDIIIGAYHNGCGGNNAGKAYVYHGSASGLNTIPLWNATGKIAYDCFGKSVASAGDVNGDGCGDIAVGACYNDDGGNNAGAAYVYLGSVTGISATASWTAAGEAAGDQFGSAVASAGDVNGDGCDEVIVGARYNDDGGSNAGAAYAYGGSGYSEYGAFASEKFSVNGSNIVRWLNISWNPVTQPGGTGARFQIGTSNDGTNFVYLGPDGTPDTYYTDPHGQAIYSEQNGKVWRYRASLHSDEEKAKSPTITDLSIVYEEYPYTAPAVEITSPNGEEILIGGEEAQIIWSASGNLVAAPISLYYSTDDGYNWTTIADGIANTGTYAWAVPDVETEEARARVVVTDVIDNKDSDISDETFVIGLHKDSINLSSGWNFVATPAMLDNSDDEVQQVFGGVETGGNPIYLYDGCAWNMMSGSDIVMTLDGIWIYSTTDEIVSLNFDTNPPSTPPTKNLEANWNAIGHSSRVPVTADSTLTTVESEWTHLIGFDAPSQSYKPEIVNDDETGSSHDEDNPMYPTNGYWLYMTDAGELGGLDGGAQAAATASAAEEEMTTLMAASSSEVPQLPRAYYGAITIDGDPAPAGTEIIAAINGTEKGSFVTTLIGVYGGPGTFDPKLLVAGSECDVGDDVTFRINGMQAHQTDTYNPGTNTNRYLSVGEVEVRGDLNSDGSVTPADAAIALAIAAGSRQCDAATLTAADVSGDNKVTSLDALMILNAAGGT